MLVIAHRGANREAIQNSREAIERAIDAGADRIEMDVQLTRDNKVIVFHDEYHRDSSGRKTYMRDADCAALQKLQLNKSETIPDLKEILDLFLDRVPINIEMKGTMADIARAEPFAAALADAVKSRDPERLIISSFHWQPLKELAIIAPELPRACLWGFDTITWPFFASFSPQVFMGWCQSQIIHPHVSFVSEQLMDQAELRNWTVYPWVEMDGEEEDRENIWTRMKTLKVAGLCTNYPREFRTWLNEAKSEAAFISEIAKTRTQGLSQHG